MDIARAAQEYCGPPAAGELEAMEPPLLAPPAADGLAAIVVAWLNEAAPADMQAHGPVVAGALQSRLTAYDLFEATVLAGLNQNLSQLMQALGLGRSGTPVTAPVLSLVCGRALRDWGAASW
jgi:hypothetical protein